MWVLADAGLVGAAEAYTNALIVGGAVGVTAVILAVIQRATWAGIVLGAIAILIGVIPIDLLTDTGFSLSSMRFLDLLGFIPSVLGIVAIVIGGLRLRRSQSAS